MDVTNAKYLLDYVYHTRDDEQFRFYKKVSKFFKYESTDLQIMCCLFKRSPIGAHTILYKSNHTF